MSLGITIQPVDVDTARHLPALAYLLLPEEWAAEIDLGQFFGWPHPLILQAVAHTLTQLDRYLCNTDDLVVDDVARSMLQGLASQAQAVVVSLHDLADWAEQHRLPEQELLDELVAAAERERYGD